MKVYCVFISWSGTNGACLDGGVELDKIFLTLDKAEKYIEDRKNRMKEQNQGLIWSDMIYDYWNYNDEYIIQEWEAD